MSVWPLQVYQMCLLTALELSEEGSSSCQAGTPCPLVPGAPLHVHLNAWAKARIKPGAAGILHKPSSMTYQLHLLAWHCCTVVQDPKIRVRHWAMSHWVMCKMFQTTNSNCKEVKTDFYCSPLCWRSLCFTKKKKRGIVSFRVIISINLSNCIW